MRLLSRYGFYTGYNGWVGFKEVEYSEWYLELPLEVEAGGSGDWVTSPLLHDDGDDSSFSNSFPYKLTVHLGASRNIFSLVGVQLLDCWIWSLLF